MCEKIYKNDMLIYLKKYLYTIIKMPEEKVDYLEVDDKLSGQDWVCLSFVDPDDMVDSKESFKVAKFLQSVCKDKDMDFKRIMEQYKDFSYKFNDELQRDYDEQCEFKTNIRGLKVRGTYSTREEADRRAKKLQTIDSDFNVFVGQVGYWLPFNPCADKIEDEHFINSQLNDMMEKYKENSINKDIFYEDQKREKVKAARDEVIRKKREEAEEMKQGEEENMLKDKEDPVQEGVIDGGGSKVVKDVMDNLSEDVSMVVEDVEDVVAKVEDVEDVVAKVEDVEDVEEVAAKVEGVAAPAKTKDLDVDLKKSLEQVDPWMVNKLKEQ
jgi:hypothetical protein